MPGRFLNLRPALFAAGALTVALLLLFLLPRFLLPYWPALATKFFLGWIAMLLLLTTVASVLWVARSESFADAFWGYAVLVDSAGVLLLLLGLITGFLGLRDVFRLYLLLLTWVGVWSAVAYLFRRRPPLAAMLAMTFSAIFFAAPIVALPLARVSSRYSPACRDHTLELIAYATPVLPAFDAVKSSLPAAHWPEWPVMYRMSDISQELGLRARWHKAALGYGLAALVVLAVGSLHPFRPKE
ncbi:MAG: hypothetical protein FWD61_05695 [Phycisphaerales bacterium]|nr:hypothetical protein [Phycisphaerales bacterium]